MDIYNKIVIIVYPLFFIFYFFYQCSSRKMWISRTMQEKTPKLSTRCSSRISIFYWVFLFFYCITTINGVIVGGILIVVWYKIVVNKITYYFYDSIIFGGPWLCTLPQLSCYSSIFLKPPTFLFLIKFWNLISLLGQSCII